MSSKQGNGDNVASVGVIPEAAFNTAFVLSVQNQQNPKEIAASNKNISRIGNLCDVPQLTKLNISFNKLLESLDGIEQIPSLKEFWCYGCSIRDLTGLSSLSKAEVIYLQHNNIDSIAEVFKAMGKLRELRLDGNKLRKIESLQSCQFLRRLDLSHNTLVAVDGLSGLQSLQELKLNHNKISSISALRGLPSLTEIDVSHNYLKSLDGIQNFIKLEIIRANYNHMVHLQLLPYANASGTTTTTGKATALHTASGSTPLNTSRSAKSTASTGTASASASNASKGGKKAANSANDNPTTKTANLPTLDKPVLTELYLSGNKIRSITGLEMYQHCLEIVDLSQNQITDVLNITAVLRDTSTLTELHLYGNPCTEDGTQMMTLENVLSANCSRFTMAFDAVITPPAVVDVEEMYHHGGGSMSNEGVLDSISVASREFHTWALDGGDSTTLPPGNSAILQEESDVEASKQSQNGDKTQKNPKKGEEADENEGEDDENDEINRMFLGPKPLLRSMLTPEQILEREEEIRNFISYAKEKLNTTVFQFLYPDAQPLGTAEKLINPLIAKKAIQKMNEKEEVRESRPPSAAEKLQSVLDRAQSSFMLEEKQAAKAVTASASVSVASSMTSTSTHIAMPKQLFRSNSSNSASKLMPSITEGALETASPPPSKPPRMASNASLLPPSSTNVVLPLDTAALKNSHSAAVERAPLSERSHFSSAASLASTMTTNTSTTTSSKTKKKLHAQISANTNTNVHTTSPEAVKSSDMLDVKNLSSNITSHGSKPWKSSAVEHEAHQSVRQELAQHMLQAGLVAPEDRLRHEEELLAFSTVKIAKQKQHRSLLVDSNVNIVTSQNIAQEQQSSEATTSLKKDKEVQEMSMKKETESKQKSENKFDKSNDENNPLSLTKDERVHFEREVSTPLTQLSRQSAPLLFLDEDEDDQYRDYVAGIAAEDDDDNDRREESTQGNQQASPSSLPSMSFKPKSIGFDRRYLEQEDDVTMGSAPVLLTPRDLSSMMSNISDNTSNQTKVIRVHSAPLARPDTSATSKPAILNTARVEVEESTNISNSVPTTPNSVSSAHSNKVTAAKSGVQGGRLLQPSTIVTRDTAADIHTRSMSSLLRFQLPSELQQVIDLESKHQPKVSPARTPRHENSSINASPSFAAADAKSLGIGSSSPATSSSSMKQGSKDSAVLFSDEDDHKSSLNHGARSPKKAYLADPVAAGKEQWIERIEAKIFALSTKEAKAAVQMTTPQIQLPSPNFFHPQSR